MHLFKFHASGPARGAAARGAEQAAASGSAVVAVYDNKEAIEAAVNELKQAGFDLSKVSVVGRDAHRAGQPAAFVTMADRVAFWGEMGALFGGLWGFVTSAALIAIPDFGLVVAMGPVGALLAGVLESAAIVGGLSALGAALFSLGVPEEHWPQYENELRAGKFLLVVSGGQQEIESARKVLADHGQTSSLVHYQGGPARG
jgi:hypothetical protein